MLDDCYNRFIEKSLRLRNRVTHASAADYFVFHSLYNKLVQKSFGRLLFLGMLQGRVDASAVEKWFDRRRTKWVCAIRRDGCKVRILRRTTTSIHFMVQSMDY